jgi:hypothetical protein
MTLTYIAEGPISTNSKHISCDPYSLLLCNITVHPQANGHAGNMSRDRHMLLCDVTARMLHSNGPSVDIGNTVPVLLAACVLRALSNRGRCLQIHCLATDLYAALSLSEVVSVDQFC